MPNNRISFGGQKRRASENRPNRKQDEIESKEYRHEKQRIRATVLCAILTNKPEYGKSYRNRPAKRSMPPRIFRTIRKYEFKSDGTTKKRTMSKHRPFSSNRIRNYIFLPTLVFLATFGAAAFFAPAAALEAAGFAATAF